MALLAFAVVSSAGVGVALHTGMLSIVTPHSGEACGHENIETGEGKENDANETAQTAGFHVSGGDGNDTGDHNETGHDHNETEDHNESGEHDDKEMCEPSETSDQHEANEAADNETDD